MNAPFCTPCPPPVCNLPAGGVLVQVFTASGVYQPSPGLITAVVECIGGGGGGGAASGATTVSVSGGGGGSGGYSKKYVPASLVLGGVTVTIGAGAGSSSGSSQPLAAATSFGALCVANGGQSGMSNAEAGGIYGLAGKGATAGVGDVAMPGASGITGPYVLYAASVPNAMPGGLGGSLFGGNVANDVNWGAAGGAPNAAPNTGAGGTGAVVNQFSGEANGGSGGSGLCIVTEYCGVAPGAGGSGGMVNVPACPPGQWGFDG